MAIINVCKLKESRVYKTQRNVLWKVYCNVCSESFAVFLSGIFSGRDRLMCYSRKQTALFICLIASVWSTTLQANMNIIAVAESSFNQRIGSAGVNFSSVLVRIVLPIEDTVIPCNGTCAYGLTIRNRPANQYFVVPGQLIYVQKGTTWSQAADTWQKALNPSSKYSNLLYRNDWEVCMAVARIDAINNMVSGSPFYPAPGVCTISRPSGSTSCTVAGTALSIDHGQLSPGKLNAHQAEATTQVTCTDAASLKVTVIPSVIDLGGGVTSSLTINDQSDGEILKVGAGATPLSIKSQLSVTGTPTAGDHSGSAVVILGFE